MNGRNNAPTADKILSLLACLLADQYGVKVTFEIKDDEKEVTSNENP